MKTLTASSTIFDAIAKMIRPQTRIWLHHSDNSYPMCLSPPIKNAFIATNIKNYGTTLKLQNQYTDTNHMRSNPNE